jgi:hypothetical protein
MRWLPGLLLLSVATVIGCGARSVAPVDEVREDLTTHLGEKVDISLADWLALPRAELAKLADEWMSTAKNLQTAARENKEAVALLPKLSPPITVPVFQEAKFSAAAGFSLPPYLKEGSKDAEVALHLARFGDREAALKVADPTDRALLSKIDTFQTAKNYPVEWTRLVGLVLSSAQFKLANGEKDGAAELVVLHRQLRALLDDKAAQGPLGAVLFSQGRRALQEAEAAWRTPAWQKTSLAEDLKAALAAWGEVPFPPTVLPPGASEAEVARVLHAQRTGRTITSATAAETQRAFDLLALPMPWEGVENVVAFLDEQNTLNELAVVYRAKVSLVFPEPANLAHELIDHGFAAGGGTTAAGTGVQRETYAGNGVAYEVNLFGRSSGFGALVRLSNPKTAAVAVTFPRSFGSVHLDQTFDQNRLAVAPEQNKDALTIAQKTALAKIQQPASQPPSEAVLQKETGHNLLASLTLRWAPELNQESLAKLALPLWAAFGDARIEGKSGPSGEYLCLTWEDAKTRLQLRLPYNDKEAPEFIAEDRRGSAALAERAEAAAGLDKGLRQQRLAAGKPQARLARFLTLEDYPLQSVVLGMDKAKALAALPRRQKVRQTPIPDGVSLLFLTDAPANVAFWPRQAFVRFGPDHRVAEIRVRFEDGLRAETKETPWLLTRLRDKPNGAPDLLPAPWAALWADLPAQKPAPVLYRWADDITLLTLQKDAGGAEVVLKDRPLDAPEGVALQPLSFVSRGVDRCTLGDKKADILNAWKISKPTFASDGALVLPGPSKSPYDAILVYFDNDRAARILARHRTKPTDLKLALQEAWSRDFDHLGMLRRQEGAAGTSKLAYGWHDDRTRVRTFAQEAEDGLRLFTEWMVWPVAQKVAASK